MVQSKFGSMSLDSSRCRPCDIDSKSGPASPCPAHQFATTCNSATTHAVSNPKQRMAAERALDLQQATPTFPQKGLVQPASPGCRKETACCMQEVWLDVGLAMLSPKA